jgi:hypothetical protein
MIARLIATALLVTATTLFIATVSTPASAKTCSNKVIAGDAMKATFHAVAKKGAAFAFAKQNWVKNCMTAKGNPWCDADNAKDISTKCNRVPSGVGTYNWTCKRYAKPCKY